MSSATSSLFFGILTRTSTLITAAEAYPKLKGSISALNIILLRKSKGTLIGKTVVNVPVEIWDLIRVEVYKVALKDANNLILKSIRCPECIHSLVCPNCLELVSTEEMMIEKDLIWSSVECESCQDNVHEFMMEILEDAHIVKNIKQLLRPFGLRLYSNQLITTREDPYYGDTTSVSPLAIVKKINRTISSTSTEVSNLGNGGPARSSVKAISSAMFDIKRPTKDKLLASIKLLLDNFSIEAVDFDPEPSRSGKDRAKRPRWLMIAKADCEM